jgi:putative PEP-CTERM system histidine kinase
VATHLEQHEADRKLAEARQFEAYNRLTAFMMHDLKNSAAQLRLIVENAERHRRNPAFVDDAIETIANAADRMTRLIDQLRGSPAPDRVSTIDVVEAAAAAIKRCAERRPAPDLVRGAAHVYVEADRERLVSALEHLIRNAQDATPEHGAVTVGVDCTASEALVSVSDTGAGMDAEFVRDRLFRPFDSTKGAKGMGVGAYQVREYVVALSGKLEVQSSPGCGARFLISLPLSSRAPAAVARVG